MDWLILFAVFACFFSPARSLISSMKFERSALLIHSPVSAYFLFFSSLLHLVWSWLNLLSQLFSHLHFFSFFLFIFSYLMRDSRKPSCSFIPLNSYIFFFRRTIFRSTINLSQSIRLFIFLYSSLNFFSSTFSYQM